MFVRFLKKVRRVQLRRGQCIYSIHYSTRRILKCWLTGHWPVSSTSDGTMSVSPHQLFRLWPPNYLSFMIVFYWELGRTILYLSQTGKPTLNEIYCNNFRWVTEEDFSDIQELAHLYCTWLRRWRRFFRIRKITCAMCMVLYVKRHWGPLHWWPRCDVDV